MMKTIDAYMGLPYTIELIQENDGTWFVAIKELPGCMSAGDTPEEAVEMIRDAQRAWLETAVEEGMPIPEPRDEEEYSGKFNLRVPKALHRKLVETADEEEVSLNTLCIAMLSEAFGAQKGLPTSAARNQWQGTILQWCRIERLDIGDQDPETVLANWIQKEITSAVQRKQGSALYHISKMLGSLGEDSPLMRVIAEMMMQMHATMQARTEELSAKSYSSLDDQIFSDVEEETTETRTIRRTRSHNSSSVWAGKSIESAQFEELANLPRSKK